jgi:hypothetical protein
MKEEILELLKDSGTTPAVIIRDNGEFRVGVYVWEDDVFCIEDGWDKPFDEYKRSKQEIILNELQEKNYVLDSSFQ